MSYQSERERFIAAVCARGMRYDQATRLLRYASTLQRLAEAQCNGDYPADNGERKVTPCVRCESQWVPHTLTRGVCKDCRTTDLAAAVVAECGPGWTMETQGDPRGYVLRVVHTEHSVPRSFGVPSRY